MEMVTPYDLQHAYRSAGSWTADTLAREVCRHADEHPDRLAVVDGSDHRQRTYGQLVDEASRLAGWLHERGIEPGDGVSVQLPNRYETVVVDLAVFMVGARLNPLLPNYRYQELRHILTSSRSRVLFTPATYRGFDHLELTSELMSEVSTLGNHVVVPDHFEDGTSTMFSDILALQPPLHRLSGEASQVSELIFTSGTEATPKAVMHTEETLNHSVRASYEHLGMSDADVVFMPSPVGHSTGLNYGIRMALLHGLPIVLQDRWNGSHAARLVEQYSCTYVLSATTFLADLLEASRRDGQDLSSLALFGCGGAPVPPELVREAQQFGVRVLRLYGSTEGLIISWNHPDSPEEKRLHSDGVVLPDTEVRVIDGDGQDLPAGSPGELLIRGPNVCVGFFDDPQRTAATFDHEGWLHSGDRGVMDDDGYLTIIGRKKDIIIRGGMNLAPREIEDAIAELSGIMDVAVIGLPDERLGEVVCACVVLGPGTAEPTVDEVGDYLTERGLARYKLPERLVVVQELPRTPTGKIQKRILTDQVVSGGDT